MKQLSGDYALESVMTTTVGDVDVTSLTLEHTNDPLNVIGQVGGVVISLMIVVGVVGNVLVLTAIIHCPQLRRSYNAFIASLSVTDLIFNVTVMPFYVDAFVTRRWRFSDAVCRWHTFFGTTVIVSSSLHIALIATSRYHVIVHPRFYDRWLSSSAAVVSQIVFAWVAAVALVLPGVIGVLPTTIGWSDQLSRCNYDRAASYGALTVIFCAGFIVPCIVIAYCYAMIWRRTREVGLRVDNYSAFRLLKARQQNGGGTVVAANSHSPLASVPSNTHIIGQETLHSVGNSHQQQTTECDKIIVANTCGSTAEQSSDKNGHSDGVMECPQGTDVDCQNKLLPVVDSETVAMEVDHIQTSEDEAPQNTSNVVQWSSTTGSKHRYTVACSSCSNKNNLNDDAGNEQTNADNNRERLNSFDHHQLVTSSRQTFGSRKHQRSSSGHSTSSKSSGYHVDEPTKDVSDTTNDNRDRSVAVDDEEFHHPPTDSESARHESISVVITPATTTAAAATSDVAAAEVTNRNDHVIAGDLLTEEGNGAARLSVSQQQLSATQHGGPALPCRRRLLGGHEFTELSPTSSTQTCSHRHRSHSLHMILAVFFAFALTYLPFAVTNLADRRAVLDRSVYMLTSLAFWAGSSVNPLIYGIMNVQFRRAYVTTVMNCWRHSVARFSTR